MGSHLPEKLRITCAVLGTLSLLTTGLRCYVRLRIVKSWGLDDYFIVVAVVMHVWYTGTLLTGIHYGTGQRTADISLMDSVHAMRCWWLCFLSYSATITFAKISAGYFFLRISGVNRFHRVTTYIVTILAALVGCSFFIVGLFQCKPIAFFWTRLQGRSGSCIDIEVIIGMTYLYGSVSLATDIAFGLLLVALIWKLRVDRRTKVLITPFLAMACVASYAAAVRMPYIKTFRAADFLYATVEISLWSTIEAGIAVLAANLATLRPLCRKVADVARSFSPKVPEQSKTKSYNPNYDLGVLNIIRVEISSKDCANGDHCTTSRVGEEEVGSTVNLARLTQHAV